jgi:SCF-associated factor 1
LKGVQITHISAQFKTFFAYSPSSDEENSVVLKGGSDVWATQAPEIVPSLQGRNVISVVLGDYHFGALTARGEL